MEWSQAQGFDGGGVLVEHRDLLLQGEGLQHGLWSASGGGSSRSLHDWSVLGAEVFKRLRDD
jgi:hypothetical protein